MAAIQVRIAGFALADPSESELFDESILECLACSRHSRPSTCPLKASARDEMVAPTMNRFEADNQLRDAKDANGHVESHFIKANSPDGARAIWVKHTLLVPRGRPEAALAEVWAIAFAEHGARKHAVKRSFPRSQLQSGTSPFSLRLPCAELVGSHARGALDGLRWEFELAPQAAPFRPFALERMYTAGFPRSKSLTPIPDASVSGQFEAFGERLGSYRLVRRTGTQLGC